MSPEPTALSPNSASPAAGAAARARLLAGYQPAADAFDELRDATGAVRPHWEALVADLAGKSVAELQRRWETGRRFIRDQGITYNIYGEPDGLDRPWRLDPVPFVISAAEWRPLEAALIQRAVLIERVLADCLGEQRLIRSGQLPPALVFAQPDFLRPLHNVKPAGRRHLPFYAADLARSPDGRWWVAADRTQIPTGAGYALANRLIASRMLPEAFRELHVQRLAGFFRDTQEMLAGLAPRTGREPRVVALTPGPYNETYFEQAYLARYLGYALVEGQDLTVRDERVFLKTLSGLEPVDVILRRVDDDFCDPLELRNDSMLGVPGLVEAVRRGHVAVANALGSGLLQSPAFMAFLPGLCRHVLGEELRLSSVATWWCGQQAAERYVEEHFDELALRPAFRAAPGVPLADRTEWLRRVRWQPESYVAQERIALSQTPVWAGDGFAAASVSVRVYLVAHGDSYRVMPGGLGRIAPDSAARFVSLQRGGASKDVWVRAEGPVEDVTLLGQASQPVELRRVGNNLPSRLADNFFWLGRYAERADATARLLRSALLRFSPESTGGAWPVLAPLLRALEEHGQLPRERRLQVRHQPEALEAELLAVVFDPARNGSLRQTAAQLRQIAILVRDRTSNDLWRVLTQFEERLAAPVGTTSLLAGDAVAVLNHSLLDFAAFHGLANDNMTRAQGWRFLDMGRRIERAIQLCTLLDCVLAASDAENLGLLEAVLEVCDCSITYRSRYSVLPQLAAVCDLVLLDDTNPRSLLFQLNQLVKHFDRLPREKLTALPGAGQRILIDCVARLRLADPRQLGRAGTKVADTEIAQIVRHVAAAMPQLSDAIAVSYFAHSSIARAGGETVAAKEVGP
ncbi:MAG TPA: circularly permuted type 2 ATP-grasp protein [Opitutaceae bacterium]|nr:circularly permuted type 2 ATP-grasp protein [Opitutaceae bacterium]